MLKSSLLIALLTTLSSNAFAQQQNKQCELIAGLTGDYYAQRLEGKTQQQLQSETPSEFANLDFIRTIDLAINLAFSFPEDKSEQEVEETVFASCTRHQ
ncbi:hypothetical protein [Methylophaga sp.]|uniref:hypothetical protein n=1 Tax=Methylophaga sp. TaxID=2024840 RepID=UPI003F69662E